MQLSKYNIYIKDDDKIQIFNTLTHSFVRIKLSFTMQGQPAIR